MRNGQISTLSNFKEYVDALHEGVGPAAACYPFLIIFVITLLCFNLFIAVISYSFNQIQTELLERDGIKPEEEIDGEMVVANRCRGGALKQEFEQTSEAQLESNMLYEETATMPSFDEAEPDKQPTLTTPFGWSTGAAAETWSDSKECNSEGWSSLPEVGTGAGGIVKSTFDSTTRRKIRMQATMP